MALLTDLQEEAAARLAAQEFFSDASAATPLPISIVTEKIGDIVNEIEVKVGQLGIVCVLQTPVARHTNKNYTRPYFDDCKIVVRTYENVLLNRSETGTRQPAALVAEAVAWFLHGFVPTGLKASLLLESVQIKDDPKILIYDTVLTLQAGLTTAPTRLTFS